jgi:hypothetical protein
VLPQRVLVAQNGYTELWVAKLAGFGPLALKQGLRPVRRDLPADDLGGA